MQVSLAIEYADRPALFGEPVEWFEGQLVGDSDGPLYIQKPNGMFLSVQPDGGYEERDTAAGTYEQCWLDPSMNVVRYKPRALVYPVAIRER